MELKDFANELVAANNFIKASFGGFAGTGKTRTATEFIIGCYDLMKIDKSKPLLFIDNEKGSRFLIPVFKEKLPDVKVLIKETNQLDDVLNAFTYLESGELSFLFIDSLTKVWYKYIDQYKLGISKKKKFMTMRDWANVLPEWQKIFADRFVQIEGNCVFTGRGGHKYEMQELEDEKGQKKKEFVQTGVKMKLAGETSFEPDLNVWMDQVQELTESGKIKNVYRDAFVMKDRANLIDGKTFRNPTFEDFRPVIEYLLNVPTGEVAKESSTKSHAPTEDTSYLKERENIEIELENIKNCFVLQQMGTSTKEKKWKVQIMEKFFNTGSWEQLKKMTYQHLRSGRIALELFFRSWTGSDEDKDEYLNEYKIQPEQTELEINDRS